MLYIVITELEQDYNVSDFTITIPAGFMNGTIDFWIDILPDDFVEGDHSFFVRIAGNEMFTTSEIDQIEVVIVDDDSKSTSTKLY